MHAWCQSGPPGHPTVSDHRSVMSISDTGLVDTARCLDVPASFDDAGAEAQVHPIARLMFSAQTNAEAFDKAQQWLRDHKVTVVDVSWHYWTGESEPLTSSIYFQFDDEPDS